MKNKFYEVVDPEKLTIDNRELSARLGAPTDNIDGEYSAILERVKSVVKPAYVAQRVKINRADNETSIGTVTTSSKAFSRFIDGCDECYAFVATLGIGADRLIMKSAQISPRESFMIDAIADALIEALCDYAEERVATGTNHSRFSPGYADFELSVTEGILKLTDAERLLGTKMTQTGLMVPRKSVSAIIRQGEGRVK